jgi:hypothetical protein
LAAAAAAAAGAAALSGVGAAPALARSTGCYPAHSTTLAASRDVRIFSKRRGYDRPEFACNVRSGATFSLGTSTTGSNGPGITSESIGGRFVAYLILRCDDRAGGCLTAQVRVLDTKTGTVRRGSRGGSGMLGLAGIVVRANGAVAYLRHFVGDTYELRRLELGGDTAIASGPDIQPFSLALAGRTIYWLSGGSVHSAQL